MEVMAVRGRLDHFIVFPDHLFFNSTALILFMTEIFLPVHAVVRHFHIFIILVFSFIHTLQFPSDQWLPATLHPSPFSQSLQISTLNVGSLF